jgi:hypothetical protein
MNAVELQQINVLWKNITKKRQLKMGQYVYAKSVK